MRPSSRRVFWRIIWPHSVPVTCAVTYIAFSTQFDFVYDLAIVCYTWIALSIIVFWFIRLQWVHSSDAKVWLTKFYFPVLWLARICTVLLFANLAAFVFAVEHPVAHRADFVHWGFALYGTMEGLCREKDQ